MIRFDSFTFIIQLNPSLSISVFCLPDFLRYMNKNTTLGTFSLSLNQSCPNLTHKRHIRMRFRHLFTYPQKTFPSHWRMKLMRVAIHWVTIYSKNNKNKINVIRFAPLFPLNGSHYVVCYFVVVFVSCSSHKYIMINYICLFIIYNSVLLIFFCVAASFVRILLFLTYTFV